MKRLILLLLACFVIPGWGEGPASDPGRKPVRVPTFEKRDSPAALLKRNPDGTLLVTIKPQVYFDELGCVMASDGEGNTFSMVYSIIAFSLEEVRYWTIWGASPGGGPPARLDPEKEYKCLIKVLNSSRDEAASACSILKVWEGEEVVYECKEMVGRERVGQPAATPDSKPAVGEKSQPESEVRRP